MNIGFLCPHSDPLAELGEPDAGGQCLYEEKVALSLAKIGHSVDSFTRHYGAKSLHEKIHDNANVFRLPMGHADFMRKEDMGPHLPEFAHNALQQFRAELDQCDLFHGHYWDGGFAALSLSLSLGKPYVFTSHSLGMLKRDRLNQADLNYPIRVPAEQKVMRSADRIIALSTVEKAALTDRYHISPEQINIVPGGVDVEKFSNNIAKTELKRKHGINTDFIVLVVGRLDDRKGFLPYLDCIPHVLQHVHAAGKTVSFLLPKGGENLAPDEAKLLNQLTTRANELDINQHIQFFGRPDDQTLAELYAAADTFACPSLYEPFGLVLVEAMAAGTAVVSTNQGGPNDIISPAVDGYLADPENPAEFGDAIAKVLCADDAVRDKMHRAALDKANNKYSWQAIGQQIADVYADVLDSQRSSHRL